MKTFVLLLGVVLILVTGLWAMERFTDYIIDNRRLEEESTVSRRKRKTMTERLRRWWDARKKR